VGERSDIGHAGPHRGRAWSSGRASHHLRLSFETRLAEQVALPVKTFQSYYRIMSALLFDTNALIKLCRENDVAKLGVFGSMARGEANDQSDIDLLVEFSKRKSLLALVSLERKMSAALGRKVDLLTEAAISPYLRDRIKRDLRVIYEAR
jgi:predicted nucleotidyltransferase